jgi:hypothetical protein
MLDWMVKERSAVRPELALRLQSGKGPTHVRTASARVLPMSPAFAGGSAATAAESFVYRLREQTASR